MSLLGERVLGCGVGGTLGVWWGRLGCRLLCEVVTSLMRMKVGFVEEV